MRAPVSSRSSSVSLRARSRASVEASRPEMISTAIRRTAAPSWLLGVRPLKIAGPEEPFAAPLSRRFQEAGEQMLQRHGLDTPRQPRVGRERLQALPGHFGSPVSM